MRSTVTRTLCVLLGVFAVAYGSVSLVSGDWRELIGQIALALLAVVLWFAMPPGATRLHTPTFGTRGLRIGLYVSLLATAAIASMRWPAWLDDSRGTDSALVLVVAAILTAPFIEAERRTRATS